MVMRNLFALAILALLTLACANPASISEPIPERALDFKRPSLPHAAIVNAWQAQTERDIRRDYLIQKLGIAHELASQIVNQVLAESEYYRLDANRILALIVIESYGNPQVISKKGAVGLMQIMPSTGKYIAKSRGEEWKGFRSLKTVETNLAFGIWYYQYLLQKFQGNTLAALAAYNWGPGEISKRHARGKALPQVYPEKVKLIREELDKELHQERGVRFWKEFDSFFYQALHCYDSGRSAPECGIDWFPLSDERGLFTSNHWALLKANGVETRH